MNIGESNLCSLNFTSPFILTGSHLALHVMNTYKMVNIHVYHFDSYSNFILTMTV